MEEYKSKFDVILDKEETIVEVFKPNKLKLFFSSMFWNTLLFIFVLIGSILGILFPDEGEVIDLLWILLPVAIFLILECGAVLFTYLYYKNVFYCYTNKRIIIRSGVFGVDFKSLDMSTIGAIDVNVTLLDKILRKNTGSIRFGSMSSPINGQGMNYTFANVTNPYETYKIIKSYIDEHKNTKNTAE